MRLLKTSEFKGLSRGRAIYYQIIILIILHSPIMRLDTGINLDATCNLQGDFESWVYSSCFLSSSTPCPLLQDLVALYSCCVVWGCYIFGLMSVLHKVCLGMPESPPSVMCAACCLQLRNWFWRRVKLPHLKKSFSECLNMFERMQWTDNTKVCHQAASQN